eukprot:TRINITY_DN128_c0_g1_i3.p1 TRINITY_DN128_c0_g1~~TRINITY_DN128_c0_g1_i3.p1  ORF type:complete len:319 (+),score=61.68 TRINITY_DN128_c0_g1_i3:311-1267(+)
MNPNCGVFNVPSQLPHNIPGYSSTYCQGSLALNGFPRQISSKLKAPPIPGPFDLRLIDETNKELLSLTFSVVGVNGEASFVTVENAESLGVTSKGSWSCCVKAGEYELRIPQKIFERSYEPRAILAHLRNPAGMENQAWIGLVPGFVIHGVEAVNDDNDLSYHHLSGRTDFDYPFEIRNLEPGEYTIRVNGSDNDVRGGEIMSVNFFIVQSLSSGIRTPRPDISQAVSSQDGNGNSLSISKGAFHCDELLEVIISTNVLENNEVDEYKRDAWIALVPEAVPRGVGTLDLEFTENSSTVKRGKDQKIVLRICLDSRLKS